MSFSKPMMFPKNWVNKFLKDNQLNDVRMELVDSIQVPYLKFWYQRADSLVQFLVPNEDV